MPYLIRKLPKQNLYRVYNKQTKKIYAYSTTLENAKKQVTLLNIIDAGVPLKKQGKGIDNPEIYEKAKEYADNIYDKSSAYKSGFIIKKYKELGGTYSGKKPETTGIARWFKEKWTDIGNKEYPVFRPTKRITKKTPLTVEEIKPSNLKKQIALKQEIKGNNNLPPFEEKTKNKILTNNKMPNAWIQHVKAYASKHKMTYRDALKDPKCKESYKTEGSVAKGSSIKKSAYMPNQEIILNVYNETQ